MWRRERCGGASQNVVHPGFGPDEDWNIRRAQRREWFRYRDRDGGTHLVRVMNELKPAPLRADNTRMRLPTTGTAVGASQRWQAVLGCGVLAVMAVVAVMLAGALLGGSGDRGGTPEERAHGVLAEELGERLRGAQMINAESGLRVSADFDGADNLSSGMVKTGMEMDMREVYRSLFAADPGIAEVTLRAHFPLTDAAGRSSREMVYETSLDRATEEQVLWDRVTDPDEVWEVDFLHVALR